MFRIFSLTIIAVLLFCPGLAPLQAQMPEAYFGIRMVDVDANRAALLKMPEERGVAVIDVADDSPAEAAGLRVGDALVTYNGEMILGAQQLVRLVRETPAGRKVRVQFWRSGKMQTAAVKLGAVQASEGLPLPGGSRMRPPTTIAAGRSIDVPDASSASLPDVPVMLLVWRSTLLNVECEGIDAQLAHYFGVKEGILVRSVETGGAADHAGLKPGDVLVSIAGHPLSSPRDLNAFHRGFRSTSTRTDSKTIDLTVVRDRKSVKLTVASLPAE